MRGRHGTATLFTCLALAASGCESPIPFYPPGHGAPHAPTIALGAPGPHAPASPSIPSASPAARPEPSGNVYAATGPGMFTPATRVLPPRVYVPNAATGTVEVIDQYTGRLVGRFRVGGSPTLIAPGHDLRRLWASDPTGGAVTSVRPRSAKRGKALRLPRPGTLYFTPDGRFALVMAGRARAIDLRHPRTLRPLGTVGLPCGGAVRADFSAAGSSLVTACPTARKVLQVDVARRQVTGVLRLPRGSRPADVRLTPDGRSFLVADTAKGGLWLIDAARHRVLGFVPTGPGAHGLVFDRSARRVFVAGRDGTVSSVDLATRRLTAAWRFRGRRHLMPGGVSPDGGTLWVSDPAAGKVFAISTRTGRPFHIARVPGRPGTPCVYPQPGRHSLGGPGALYR
jgi:DNA-binding beta-propeller fold protein YncE